MLWNITAFFTFTLNTMVPNKLSTVLVPDNKAGLLVSYTRVYMHLWTPTNTWQRQYFSRLWSNTRPLPHISLRHQFQLKPPPPTPATPTPLSLPIIAIRNEILMRLLKHLSSNISHRQLQILTVQVILVYFSLSLSVCLLLLLAVEMPDWWKSREKWWIASCGQKISQSRNGSSQKLKKFQAK